MKKNTSVQSPITGAETASILKNTAYLLGGRWVTRLSRVLYMILLARFLAPEQFGILNYGMSWYMTFFALNGIGLGGILSREIGENPAKAKDIIAQTLTIRIIGMIFLSLTCAGAAWLFEKEPEVSRLLRFFSLTLPGRSLAIWTEYVFTAYEANQYTLWQRSIYRPFEIVAGILAIFTGQGLLMFAFIHALTWWCQAIHGLWVIHYRFVPLTVTWNARKLRYILQQGFLIGLGDLGNSWIRQAPLVLFRYLRGTGAMLGQLALAMQAFSLVAPITATLNTATLPFLSRSIARQDGKERKFVSTMLRFSIFLGTFVSLMSMCVGPWLVNVLFGVQYLDVGHLLGQVMWLLIPWTWGQTMRRLYIAKRQYANILWGMGLGGAVFSAGIAGLTHIYGASGVIWATVAGMTTWAGFLIALEWKAENLNLWPCLVKPGVTAVPAVGVYVGLVSLNAWAALCSSILVLGGGMLLFVGFSPEERTLLLRCVQSIKGRSVK